MATIRSAVYAGSFDPPTNGHLFMIEEGAKLFDKLVVAIGVNPEKKPLFTVEARLELLRAIVKPWSNVEVTSFEARYLIDYAAQKGAGYILRGIRNSTDFQFEQTMRNVNADLNRAVSTVFLMPPRDLAEVSSSFVKGLVGPRGWRKVVKTMVPDPVFAAISERLKDKLPGDDAPEPVDPSDPEA